MTHVLDALGRIKEYWGSVALADLDDYARGVIIRGGAIAYEAYAAETAGAVLIGDGTDIISDVTPTIAGLVTGQAGFIATGYTIAGAPAAADYMVFGMDSPDGRIFAYDPVAAAYLALLSDVDIYRLRYTSIDINVLHYLLRLEVFTSNVAAAGLGTGIEFQIEDDGGGADVLGTIECISTDATAGAEHGAVIIRTADIGDDGLEERWRWNEDGEVTANVGGADVGFLHAEGWMGPTFAFPAKNTTGGAVAANDVGYIDSAGEFKYSSVDYEDVAWCVVIEGGANNADIYVTRRGRVTVELNANCAVGDFLYMANVGGNQQRARTEIYMRPEMFAVALTANVAGAGGTCEALLYCHRKSRPLTSTNDVFRNNASDDSDWSSTQNGAPVGAVITYNVPLAAGAEDSITPAAVGELCKLVLHNTTRGEEAYIQSVNIGANTITVTAAADVAAWVNGNVLSVRSQTNLQPYFDLDATSTEIPALATTLIMTVIVIDSGGAVGLTRLHPYEAYAGSKTQDQSSPGGGQRNARTLEVNLIDRRFTYQVAASGAGTMLSLLRMMGCVEAAP